MIYNICLKIMGRQKISEDQLNKTKIIFKGNPRLYYKNQTVVDFKLVKNHPLYPKTQGKPTFPTFTNDNKYYTPSFSLPRLDEFKEEDCLKIHQHKMEESTKQIDQQQIMVPKPSSKSQFCGVCRACYEDYMTHLEEGKHLKMLAESRFQKQIVGLCEYFDTSNKDSTEAEILKKVSTQTKIHQDQSCTECFVDDKKSVICVVN